MTEREKIIDVLNKNFTQEVECTPVYTTADGKEIELPQELCDIFNDIVTQAVIPYFADALIAAGIGDMSKRPIDPTYEEYATQVHNLAIEEQKQRARAEEMRLANEERKQAVKEFAERVKMAFYYEFDELIPSIMADKIDELVKEICGDD